MSTFQEYARREHCSNYAKVRAKLTNSPDGWHRLLDWLITKRSNGSTPVWNSTGRYRLGMTCAFYEADHVVSASLQYDDFVRTSSGATD